MPANAAKLRTKNSAEIIGLFLVMTRTELITATVAKNVKNII